MIQRIWNWGAALMGLMLLGACAQGPEKNPA